MVRYPKREAILKEFLPEEITAKSIEKGVLSSGGGCTNRTKPLFECTSKQEFEENDIMA